jgi:AcrR family transcriptional regulator
MTDEGTPGPRRPREEPKGRRGRGRPRDPEADKAILQATLELFLERGVDLSIEQVAKRAGVSKVTIYRRWPTKEGLILQAANAMRGQSIPDSAIAEHLEDPFSPDATRKMLPLQVEMFTRPEFRRGLAQMLAATQTYPALLAAWREGFIEPRQKLFSAAIERLTASGAMPADTDADVLWDQVLGALFVRLLLYPELPDPDEMRHYLITLARQTGLPLPDDIEDSPSREDS